MRSNPGLSAGVRRLLISFCVLLLFLCSPFRAHARDWRISNFHTTIAVMDDSTVVVSERINLVFNGQFNGIHRTIPIQYPDPRGSNYTLFLDVRDVTDGNGNALKYESSIKGEYRDLKIYIPGAEDTSRVVQINYVVNNAIRFFTDHDELYWNVTGNDWPVPIDHASAFVTMPASASGSLRAQAFTGAYGSASREATAEVKGSNVSFETTNPLSMRGGLTIDIFIPKGIIPEPSTPTKVWWWLRSNPIVVLPVFSFAVMFLLWWYKGRDPESGLSVAPMYEAPRGMTPAEVGALVDDSVDPRDITSTLVDLAVRGYLKIEEHNDKVLFFNNRDYIFHLLKPHAEWSDLSPHEQTILTNMFSVGESQTRLSSLKNRFYVAIPTIKKNILTELREKGMYTVDPDTANAYRILGVLLIAAPFVAAQVTGIAQFFLSPVIAITSIALAIVPVMLFGYFMTAKTLKGVRTVVEIRGFKEFMTRVEEDRLRRMPPDTFEKFLPFAMSLGIEKQWASRFEGIIQNPPNWYVGPRPMGMWNPLYFTNSMHSMTNSAYESFVAAPRASSGGSGFSGGGGFGGGGFSGGGFGGGGGSAF